MEKKVKSFAINQLRRASMRWGPKNAAKKAAKIEYGKYKCESCQNIVRAKDTQLDHKIPVVPVEGWDSFDGFIERLFCPQDGYQLLCSDCHNTKTQEENTQRREGKDEADVNFRKRKKNGPKRTAKKSKRGRTRTSNGKNRRKA